MNLGLLLFLFFFFFFFFLGGGGGRGWMGRADELSHAMYLLHHLVRCVGPLLGHEGTGTYIHASLSSCVE